MFLCLLLQKIILDNKATTIAYFAKLFAICSAYKNASLLVDMSFLLKIWDFKIEKIIWGNSKFVIFQAK